MRSSDLSLKAIELWVGRDVAELVSEVMLHEFDSSNLFRRNSVRRRLGSPNRLVNMAVEQMVVNLETPLSCRTIARHIGISVRQLERLFRSYLQKSPSAYYRDLRLRKARNLLKTTDESISEIAHQVGYATASHFSKSYSDFFSCRPSDDR
ncbi:MAG: helix-turn-helix domain-containing protein [Thalassospira sp.]|uniref:helix-turn-helix domain-containing protein n=1 Tax=Thalassospira sp. TaxID=1912094 RepID=UPI003A87DB63